MCFRKLDFRRGHYGLPEIATEVGGGAEISGRLIHPGIRDVKGGALVAESLADVQLGDAADQKGGAGDGEEEHE